MGAPAAKQGDRIVATDIHIILIPSAAGPIPTPLPHPFSGSLDSALSQDVKIESKAAATQGSKARNAPPHVPQGGPFQNPPTNQAEVLLGSATVFINGRPAARMGDTALTCNDPSDLPGGQIIANSTVLIGG